MAADILEIAFDYESSLIIFLGTTCIVPCCEDLTYPISWLDSL
jgi:hypothetical protein